MNEFVLERPAPVDKDGLADLADERAYRAWREAKLDDRPRHADDLVVDLRDPAALTDAERAALLDRCARWNMVVYRGPADGVDAAAVRRLGEQLGLRRLDGNWLADDDGLSRITVGQGSDDRGGFIPYTDRAIQWHTDGYYHPEARRIRAMVLHCVRPAAQGGVNRLIDHELAYIALRDASPRWLQALMAPDAMTIPAREDDERRGPAGADRPGVQRRSARWPSAHALHGAHAQHRLGGRRGHGQGGRLPGAPAGHRATHCRSAWRRAWASSPTTCCTTAAPSSDDPAAPRLLYRARYLDRVGGAAWRNG